MAGTEVLVNPGVFCGECDLCQRGRPNICRRGGLLGRDADGTFAEFIAVDERLLHPLPAGLSADATALLQVLATCVRAHSLRDAHALATSALATSALATSAAAAAPAPASAIPVSIPDSAVVVGLGVTGLLHVQLLRARGVPVIVGVTRSAWKRELAVRFGATAVATPDQAARIVAEVTGGRGAELGVECAGSATTVVMTFDLVGAGATVLQFGTTGPTSDGLPTYQWYAKELTILNPRAQRPEDCAAAIGLAAAGQVDLAPLVTARFPVDRVSDALRACADPAHLKVVLEPS